MMCRGECLALLFAAKIHTNFVCFHPQIGHCTSIPASVSPIRSYIIHLSSDSTSEEEILGQSTNRRIGHVHSTPQSTTSWSQKFLRNFSCYFQFVALCMCIPRPFEIILDYSVILDLYEEPFLSERKLAGMLLIANNNRLLAS